GRVAGDELVRTSDEGGGYGPTSLWRRRLDAREEVVVRIGRCGEVTEQSRYAACSASVRGEVDGATCVGVALLEQMQEESCRLGVPEKLFFVFGVAGVGFVETHVETVEETDTRNPRSV